MSVLIKGITLEQFYRDLNNVRDMDVGWDVVQLPPHGRLIDADALVKKQPIPELGAPRWLIEQAPTIIESEGADER